MSTTPPIVKLPANTLAWLPAPAYKFEQVVLIGPPPGDGRGVKISIAPRLKSFDTSTVSLGGLLGHLVGLEAKIQYHF
jgi:hypothetical protein